MRSAILEEHAEFFHCIYLVMHFTILSPNADRTTHMIRHKHLFVTPGLSPPVCMRSTSARLWWLATESF